MQEVSIFLCCILILFIFFQKESLILISRGHHLETSVTSKMADLEFSVE